MEIKPTKKCVSKEVLTDAENSESSSIQIFKNVIDKA
ncbi:Uncharacterised protein [Yersinia nurmii]|uniref:Uncharacterized protein n=1 Tax=Yersinia nurmii TaxID=685706 RepID=A0ABP1Y3T8_9GAMM|nr:Uncharacterised protein [Yersinia nurmii]